jgi:hypothetical protein
MDIRDYLPSGLVPVTPSDTTDIAGIIAVRVANQTAGWISLRFRETDGSDITLSFPPGLTVETATFDRVYATNPVPAANVTVHAYIRGR